MGMLKRQLGNICIFEINEHVASSKVASKYKDFLLEQLTGNEQAIIIDCRKISYIDTVFLGAMVFALKKGAKQAKISFVNDKADSQIWTIFETNNLKAFFNVFETLDDAIGYVHLPESNKLKIAN